jgi:hypothetical protein
MKRIIFPLIFGLLLTASCGNQQDQSTGIEMTNFLEQRLPGDSAYYGLACDGSTDSILILMPMSGTDLDTFDILNAFLNRRVLGRPNIGDQMTVVRDTANPGMAYMVVNLSSLKGEWCYQVMPQLRLHRINDSLHLSMPAIPDSLRQRWMQPREYGFEIRRENAVRPIGVVRNNASIQQSPVTYPSVKQYREWKMFNGRLILSEFRRDTLGKRQTVSIDTADIILLRRDSMRLRFKYSEQSYYRRKRK